MIGANQGSSLIADDGSRSRGRPPLRVALLSDRALCSACLRIALREAAEDVELIGAAGPDATLSAHTAHIAVVTLLAPRPADFAELAARAATLPGVPLVVLTDRGEPQLVNELLKYGARGVLTFDLDFADLAAALRLVHAGGIYVPPQPGPAPHGGERMRTPTRNRLERLSPRERAVLDLLRRSMSNREIAGTLGIAEATVKIHVRNLLRKTRARNRVELALLAVQGDV